MDSKLLTALLGEQTVTMKAAVQVLKESHDRVSLFLGAPTQPFTIEQRESCEALTSRYARLCDFLFQKIFRTIDRIELQDEGSMLDRLNRMEKRGIISNASRWRDLRELRNSIAHEYLIESSDQVLKDAFDSATELFETAKKVESYITAKHYLN